MKHSVTFSFQSTSSLIRERNNLSKSFKGVTKGFNPLPLQ
ncbi:hypothetical protein LEP1GSC082_1832 [Leptospira kirschneri str. H2]|nr:hypothetical protein LEP1GSC082_1832 [Leptospira kirschneri str. H2]